MSSFWFEHASKGIRQCVPPTARCPSLPLCIHEVDITCICHRCIRGGYTSRTYLLRTASVVKACARRAGSVDHTALWHAQRVDAVSGHGVYRCAPASRCLNQKDVSCQRFCVNRSCHLNVFGPPMSVPCVVNGPNTFADAGWFTPSSSPRCWGGRFPQR